MGNVNRGMRAAALVVAAAALALGCGSDGSDLDQALCNDLDAGMGLMQIRPDDMEPERFAQAVYTATEDECPEHQDRQDVQALLGAWGLAR